MQSLTPLYPVMFQHDGGWKTGTLMNECVLKPGPLHRLVKLESTGEVVCVRESEIQKNPCREDERREEVANG